MNSLKFALSTQESPSKTKGDLDGSLLKGVNKSKNQSIWAFDMDNNEQATEQSMQSDNLMKILHEKLQAAYLKDSKNISQITLQRIIEQFQDEAGGSKSELSYLMVIEDKLGDILQFAKQDFKKFLNLFNEMIASKMARLRKKQQNSELKKYDNIVSGNFKKKIEQKPFLTVQNPALDKRSRDKNRLNSKSPNRKENSSNENKLVRLFSKDKKTVKERELKESSKREEDEGRMNATHAEEKDESVSFSTVLATSVAVKSRRRKQSNQYKEKKHKPKKNENAEEDKQDGDQAFIFFRPKKGKK